MEVTTMKPVYILGIESSCDDTSAAVIRDGILLSNVTASQAVHMEYGGVVPELASRAHQQNIVPVVLVNQVPSVLQHQALLLRRTVEDRQQRYQGVFHEQEL